MTWMKSLWALALVGGTALAEPPASKASPLPPVPFDAKATRPLELFRGRDLKPNDMTQIPAGAIVTVTAVGKEQKWEGQQEQVVEVKLDARSTYSAMLSRLEPVSEAGVVSTSQAGTLLFSRLPEARRSWCEQFTRRLLVSPEGPRVLVYSTSSDEDCRGYLMVVAGTGPAAKVLASARRGVLQSVRLHEVPKSPAVLEVEESIQGGIRVNGIRQAFLALEKESFRELLAVDIRRDELQQKTKHSVVSEVEVKPSGERLDIEVRRTEMQVALATGAESGHKKETRRYSYAGGRLSAQPKSQDAK